MTNSNTSWELWHKIQKLSKDARKVLIALVDLILKREGG